MSDTVRFHSTAHGAPRSQEEVAWIDDRLEELRRRSQDRVEQGSVTYDVSRWLDVHQKVAARKLSGMDKLRLAHLQVCGNMRA